MGLGIGLGLDISLSLSLNIFGFGGGRGLGFWMHLTAFFDINAFSMPPLATLEMQVKVDDTKIFRTANPQQLSTHTKMNRNVGVLRLFPSITVECVKAFLQVFLKYFFFQTKIYIQIFPEPMQGIVLQTFGAGNFPSLRTDLVNVIRKAVKERGVLIVNISQCQHGEVDELAYATGEVKNFQQNRKMKSVRCPVGFGSIFNVL